MTQQTGEVLKQCGESSTGPNLNYKGPPRKRWHTVEVIAAEGTEFGLANDNDNDNGTLAIVTRRKGEEWPHGVKPEAGGVNTIAPGHRVYRVQSEDSGADIADRDATIERLRKALVPFANVGMRFNRSDISDGAIVREIHLGRKGEELPCIITVGDCRKAVAALAGEPEGHLPATILDADEHRECHMCGVPLAGKQSHFDESGNAYCMLHSKGEPEVTK